MGVKEQFSIYHRDKVLTEIGEIKSIKLYMPIIDFQIKPGLIQSYISYHIFVRLSPHPVSGSEDPPSIIKTVWS